MARKLSCEVRTAIRRVHAELAALGLIVHEKKRFIGRTTAGFDLLGYSLHPLRRLTLSSESVRRLKIRTRRLYEQGASIERLCAVTLPGGATGCGAGSDGTGCGCS